MLALANASNEARGSILDSLKTLNQAGGITDNSELQQSSREETNVWTAVFLACTDSARTTGRR